MHLRRNLVVIFCFCLFGLLALSASLAPPASPSSLAMYQATPETPEMFCPTPMAFDDETGFAPVSVAAGVVPVPDIDNPSGPDSGNLRLTQIALPTGTCFTTAYFYPGAVVTVLSGEISVLVTRTSIVDPAPVANMTVDGLGDPQPRANDRSFLMTEADWLTIRDGGALVAFRGETADATFIVAGLKPNGDPGGGGGVHRGRP